jgi:hypothetical protein
MDFTWGDRHLKFELFTGTVMSSSKWSETHVSSSGGGGYLHGGSGQVSAPTVSSTVKSKHEFWVQTPDGHQIPVQLTDADFPLMPGQLITLVNTPSANKPAEHRWTYVRNHSAKQSWVLNESTTAAAASLHPMRPWSIALTVALLLLGFFVTGIFVFAAIIYGGYRLFRRYMDQKAIRAALVARMQEIAPLSAPPTTAAA